MKIQAADVLYKNSNTIVDNLFKWININYPTRTTEILKCRRDLQKIVYGIISGLRFNNSEEIQFLVEEFYFGGSLKLKSTNVEIEVYKLLKTKINECFDNNSVEAGSKDYVSMLIDILISQLQNGLVSTEMNPVKASLIAERCQRNWDFNNPISLDDIGKIVNSATAMPSKQNRKYHKLIVSNDYEFNRICYNHSIDPTNPDFMKRLPFHRNTQVLAPLLLIYLTVDENLIVDPFGDDYMKNFYTTTGISSGVAAHTAALMGYRAGFCACVNWEPLFEDLYQKYNISKPPYNHGLMLGIGAPDITHGRQEIVVNNDYKYTVTDTYDKVMDIHFQINNITNDRPYFPID
jgi:hypothetical protein